MYELIVNGNVVAICAEGVVGIFREALFKHLPLESSFECKKHQPKPQPVEEESGDNEKA